MFGRENLISIKYIYMVMSKLAFSYATNFKETNLLSKLQSCKLAIAQYSSAILFTLSVQLFQVFQNHDLEKYKPLFSFFCLFLAHSMNFSNHLFAFQPSWSLLLWKQTQRLVKKQLRCCLYGGPALFCSDLPSGLILYDILFCLYERRASLPR